MRPKTQNPGPGQESVWDYPRPPAVEPCPHTIRIVLGGQTIGRSNQAWRVLETSHPPVYYIPLQDFEPGVLEITDKTSFCEFKGQAYYLNVSGGNQMRPSAAWTYLKPSPRFAVIRGHVAVYAQEMDDCFVGDRRVQPQAGDFYGGWITDDIVGPFKGEPGTWGW